MKASLTCKRTKQGVDISGTDSNAVELLAKPDQTSSRQFK